MTTEEYRAHFSLWAILAAPLIIGADPRNLTPAALEIYSNAEVIAVDQDVLGLQVGRECVHARACAGMCPVGSKCAFELTVATAVCQGGKVWTQDRDREVWARFLDEDSVAVVLFNRGNERRWRYEAAGAITDSQCPNVGGYAGVRTAEECQELCNRNGGNACNHSTELSYCVCRTCEVVPPPTELDPLPGWRVYSSEGLPTDMTFSWPDMLPDYRGAASVRDLWLHEELGDDLTRITLPVMPHACRMLKLYRKPREVLEAEAE